MSANPAFRPDMERLRILNNETRSPARLLAHYRVERELAARLRSSRLGERSSLYSELYSELFARLPDHPQHKIDPTKRRGDAEKQIAFLRSYLSVNSTFVEIGCGDAAVTQGIAPYVHAAFGVDVTSALIDAAAFPKNCRFIQTNGTDIGVEAGSADVVYSNQLMEHLHPEDAKKQLLEIWRILKPDGVYICSTPNKITGPHDISCYFDFEPFGFHLREYNHNSLAAMFRETGFRSVTAQISIKGMKLSVPVAPVGFAERVLLRLPRKLQRRLLSIGAIRNIAGVTMIGWK